MTPGQIITDVADTIMLWQREGLKPRDAWLELTGHERNFVEWAQVEDFMIGWAQSYQPAPRQLHLRLAA